MERFSPWTMEKGYCLTTLGGGGGGGGGDRGGGGTGGGGGAPGKHRKRSRATSATRCTMQAQGILYLVDSDAAAAS